MTTAELNARMRQVLVQLELCSNGTTTAYNPAGGGGHSKKPGGERPRGGDSAPHLYWHQQYIACNDDTARSTVLDDAERELAQITGRGVSAHQRPSETPEEARAAVLDATHGWRPEDATRSASARGISARTLRRWRREANRDPETGEPQHERLNLDDKSARLMARRLVHSLGYSQRAAAARLGVNQSTISRWTKTNTNDDIKEDVAA